jgi:hypothetical protein
MASETDPLGFALTADGDLEITTTGAGAGIRLTSGLEAVADNLDEALGTFKGEYFLDLENGTPWFQDVLGQKYSERRVLDIFRSRILGVTYVDTILSITPVFTADTRVFALDYVVDTAFGPLTGEFTL